MWRVRQLRQSSASWVSGWQQSRALPCCIQCCRCTSICTATAVTPISTAASAVYIGTSSRTFTSTSSPSSASPNGKKENKEEKSSGNDSNNDGSSTSSSSQSRPSRLSAPTRLASAIRRRPFLTTFLLAVAVGIGAAWGWQRRRRRLQLKEEESLIEVEPILRPPTPTTPVPVTPLPDWATTPQLASFASLLTALPWIVDAARNGTEHDKWTRAEQSLFSHKLTVDDETPIQALDHIRQLLHEGPVLDVLRKDVSPKVLVSALNTLVIDATVDPQMAKVAAACIKQMCTKGKKSSRLTWVEQYINGQA